MDSESSKEHCYNDHQLAWSTDLTDYENGKANCNVCNNFADIKRGRWVCPPCGYNVCSTCRPGDFECCKNKHALQWIVDSTGMAGGKFSCDNCHDSTGCDEGRWNCKECGYDICSNCRKKDYKRCNKGHGMKWTKEEYPGGVFSCDGCKSSTSCKDGRWGCKDCGFDICTKCRKFSYPKCKAGHPLIWSYSIKKYPGGKFSCDGCKASTNGAGGRWSCKICNFDICNKCRPAKPYGGCKTNHPLKWRTSAEGYAGGAFSCDECHSSSKCAEGRWGCKDCGYDVCTKCREPEQFSCCNKSHPMNWSSDPAGYAGGAFSCDNCKNSDKCQNGRWCCKDCGFDICTECKVDAS